MKIYTFHLLNDYSGSPKVLMQSIKAWVKAGHEVEVITCNRREGFLSDLDGVNYTYFCYKLGANQLLKIIFLIWSQLFIFMRLLLKVKKEDLIYINTVLPFGAAFLGLIKGCRIIYHIHETSIKPIIFKKLLFKIVELTSNEIIYVSKYLYQEEKLNCKKTYILHNAIENDFIRAASAQKENLTLYKNVLMVCSLKEYKGVNEFVKLSEILKQYDFKLVVNASESEIERFFKLETLPQNLEIFSTQTNLHPFYSWADLVLNLSKPDGWVETFGLTVLEAMAYGLPVIVPPVGGVVELVEDGINGFLSDSRNINEVSIKVETILENKTLYNCMKTNALKKIDYYKEDVFESKSIRIIENGCAKFLRIFHNLKLKYND